MQRGSRVELRSGSQTEIASKNIHTHVSNLVQFKLELPAINRDEPLSDFHEVDAHEIVRARHWLMRSLNHADKTALASFDLSTERSSESAQAKTRADIYQNSFVLGWFIHCISWLFLKMTATATDAYKQSSKHTPSEWVAEQKKYTIHPHCASTSIASPICINLKAAAVNVSVNIWICT